MNSIYLFDRYFGEKHQNDWKIAEMGDYDG